MSVIWLQTRRDPLKHAGTAGCPRPGYVQTRYKCFISVSVTQSCSILASIKRLGSSWHVNDSIQVTFLAQKMWSKDNEPIAASIVAQRTQNPIRNIVDQLKVQPHPEKPMISLALGKKINAEISVSNER